MSFTCVRIRLVSHLPVKDWGDVRRTCATVQTTSDAVASVEVTCDVPVSGWW